MNNHKTMEISAPAKDALKIKTKDVSISVDSDEKESAVVIVLDKEKIGSVNEKLYVEGPGEYETKGVRVSARGVDGNTVYDVFNGAFSLKLMTSNVLKKSSDDDECDVIVVKKIDPDFDESEYAALNSEVVLVYGDDTNISNHPSVKTINKLNLKNIGEHKGSVLFLS